VRRDGSQETRIVGLQVKIYDIACLADEGMSQICAVAGLALRSMESPATHRFGATDMADLFKVIRVLAENTNSCIGFEASEAGCAYSDAGRERRMNAALQAHQQSLGLGERADAA